MPPPDYYKAKKSNWGAKKTTSKKGKGRKSSKVAQKGTKTKLSITPNLNCNCKNSLLVISITTSRYCV